jgi:S1-C subfamily serine protease
MAAKVTKALTTGMKVLGGGNVSAYTLEHLSNSRKHPAGSFETIIIPYIELGRDGSNAVSFGDDMSTVSRKHAAIERKGDNVVIKNLSTNNPTLVNGRPVKNEYFLNNGDEIQLSLEGPRMRFNLSATGTAKMGVTRRMNLVMQQAVRPYRAAVAGLAAMVILISGVGGFLTYTQITHLTIKNDELVIKTDSILKASDVAKNELLATIDNMKKTNNDALEKLSKNNASLTGKLNNLSAQNQQLRADVTVLATAPKNSNEELAEAYDGLKNHVYYLEVVEFQLQYPDGSVEDVPMGWTGTGFMLSDGRFVTARHCVQGWRFGTEETDIILNSLEQAGVKFNLKFRCTSPSQQLSFTYSDFKVNDSHDETVDLAEYDMDGIVKLAALDRYDWAYVKTSNTEGLMFDNDLSKSLKAGSKVFALGFTEGFGGSDNSASVSPMLGEATVGQSGLTKDGNISVTSKGWGAGNSGGPVLTKAKDGFKVVGIVSWGPHIKGDIGFLVPVDEVK